MCDKKKKEKERDLLQGKKSFKINLC
jgi:hypothetical protein